MDDRKRLEDKALRDVRALLNRLMKQLIDQHMSAAAELHRWAK